MADFTLSTKKPANVREGGLRPDLLPEGGGAARGLMTGRINPNAGQIGFTPVQTNPVIGDVAGASMLKFLAVTTESVFKYQDREAQVLANHAASQFSERVSQLFNGYADQDGKFVKGFSQSQGVETITAYGTFQETLDENFNEFINGLEPRVRQKALLQLQNTRNQYLAKAASHRVTELKKAEEQERFLKQRRLMTQLAMDPSLLQADAQGNLPIVDQATGYNIRDKFFSSYDAGEIEKSTNDWANLLKSTTEQIYWEQGANAAGAFYNQIAKYELAGIGAIGTSVAIQSNVHKWTMDEVDTQLKTLQREEKLLDKQIKQVQDYNYKFVYERIGTPDQVSLPTMQAMIASGQLERDAGNSLVKSLYGELAFKPNYDMVNGQKAHYIDLMTKATTMENGIPVYVDDMGQRMPVDAFRYDQIIIADKDALAELNKRYEQIGQVDAQRVSRVMRGAEVFFKDMFDVMGLDEAKRKIQMNEAQRQIELAIQENKITPFTTDGEIIDFVIQNNAKLTDIYAAMQGTKLIGIEGLPKTYSDIADFALRNERLYQQYQSRPDSRHPAGGISHREYVYNIQRLELLQDSFKKEKQNLIDDVNQE